MHKPKVLAMVRFKQREEQLLDSTKLQTFDPTQTDPEWRNGGKRRIPGSEAESGENMGTGSFLARNQISLMKGLGKRKVRKYGRTLESLQVKFMLDPECFWLPWMESF